MHVLCMLSARDKCLIQSLYLEDTYEAIHLRIQLSWPNLAESVGILTVGIFGVLYKLWPKSQSPAKSRYVVYQSL